MHNICKNQFNLIFVRLINMVTSIVFIALIGTLQFNSAISAAINYEPIKITVNENFNAQPGQVSSKLQEPGFLHQGANFYFKPQVNLPPSYIPSHIEGLISLIQQHHHSCTKDASKVVVEKDKLIEVLKSFLYPVSEISKNTLSKFFLEKDNNSEILKPIIITEQLKPVTPELLVIPEAPVLLALSLNGIPPIIEEEAKKEKSEILEESTGVFRTIPGIAVRPITETIVNFVEPKPINPELVVIPEAPVLPPLYANDIHVVGEEFKIEEPIVVDIEFKPDVQELLAIPEAPVLPSLSFHDISSMIEEEVKKEELVIFDEPMRVFPTIPEIDVRPIEEPIVNYVESKPINAELVVIPEAPVLPPLSANDIHVVEEEVKIEEPIVVDIEFKPAVQELLAIPEAPVLPSLSLHDISSIIKNQAKKEKSVILEEPTSGFPTIPGIAVRPITETIVNFVEPKPINAELVVIPEAPVLPPLSANDIHVVEEEVKIEEPIVVDIEFKPAAQELLAIPEAPVLPSLSLHDISSIIKDQAKKEKSVILEEPTSGFPTIPGIAVRPITETIVNYVEPKPINAELVVIPEAPVLPPLSANDIHVVEEEVKIEEPIVVDIEFKPAVQELLAIPEAPVLPSLSLHDISSIIKDQAKKEKSVILEEPTSGFPTIPGIAVRPITETIVNYVEPKPINAELVVIPEAPVLPPLSENDIHVVEEEVKIEEPIVFDIEFKPAIQELLAIPEAPVLPSLSLHDISSTIKEEAKKEKSVILEEPTGVFPTIPGIAVRPITETIVNFVEPKPINAELVVIPEAPVLPPLSANDIQVVEEEVKIEEPVVFDIEFKPAIQELLAIPEAPVLPSLSLHHISSIIKEEAKKEKSVILEEPTGVFPTIPEIAVRPITETIVNYVEPKPNNAELVVIPEAPVLPPLSANDIYVIEEEVKIEEPIVVDVEPRPITAGFLVIPEAPVLPQPSYNGIHPIVKDVKIEESIKHQEPTSVFPSISEISARPFPEPLVVSETVESFALENNIFPIATEKVKIEVPILFKESIEVFPPTAKICSGPTLQESELTDSYVWEEVSQPNPESVVTIKETLQPTIIPKPSNNMGVLHAPKTRKLMIPKPASVGRLDCL